MRKCLILAMLLTAVGLGAASSTARAQDPGAPPARRSILSRMFPRTYAAFRAPESPAEPPAEPPANDDPRKSRDWSSSRNLPAPKPWMQGAAPR